VPSANRRLRQRSVQRATARWVYQQQQDQHPRPLHTQRSFVGPVPRFRTRCQQQAIRQSDANPKSRIARRAVRIAATHRRIGWEAGRTRPAGECRLTSRRSSNPPPGHHRWSSSSAVPLGKLVRRGTVKLRLRTTQSRANATYLQSLPRSSASTVSGATSLLANEKNVR